MAEQCQVCGSAATTVFFELENMPVLIGTLWPGAAEAKNTEMGDLRLVYCSDCGFIWNEVFDPELLAYSQTYENSLHFSDVFQKYTSELVTRLVESYGIRNKDVIDIGCGKGDFLAMLCEQGDNRGVGFDPSYEGDRITGPVAERLTFHQDLFSKKYADLKADMLTSRYVFEHVTNPVDFLQMILDGLGKDADALIYFEVPNARLILEDLSVWDIIYEHCSYFGLESLAAAFHRAGFQILDLRETYGRQFISIDARYGGAEAQRWGDLQQLTQLVDNFSTEFKRRITEWHDKLDSLRRDRKRVVAWGAGAKAVGFLNMLELSDQDLPYVVDINPHKQGTFLGGTGQEVVSPEFLVDYQPDAIILMNPVYKDEIAQQISSLGLSVEFIAA
jgi:SAM-dependent methyltransferase